IVGTNQTLLKEYLRLTSAPKPANVRPLEVLQRTMILLRQKWQDEHDYNFLCTQLKSVRQDLTVQLIKNSFTVDVYEFHARIALEKSDIGEFNQCQTQLKSLYQLGIEGSEMEFIAYRILYFLMAKNHSDIMLLMKKLTVDQRNNPFIAHALQVRSELSLGNYGRFFQLVASAPNNGRYILNQFLARERNMALAAICKAYGPTRLPMNFIQSQLGFASLAAAIEFTSKEINMELSDPANYPTCKVAHLKVMEKMRKLGKVDIKGQI
ncbi:SAC3/GANP domain-containing protein, partial [Hesseltinella vesiculosa]